MRSLGGFVLLAGIGVGLFVYLPTPVDRNTSLEHVRRLAAARVVQSRPPVAPQPQTRLIAFAPPALPLKSLARHKTLPQSQPASVSVRTAALGTPEQRAPVTWQVTATPAILHAQSGPLTPTDPSNRYELVVEIQQQLKRLGCYYGRIDGSWGAGSKEAMRFFTDRVNAALPLEEPDHVQLTLLRAQTGRTCDECPAGQAPSSGGRCVPQSFVAQSTPNEAPPWKTATVRSGNPPAAAAPLFKPVATSVVSSEPLPGRMTIGGPKTLPPLDSLDSQPIAVGAGDSRQGLATAALAQDGSTPSVAPSSAPKPSSSYKRPRHSRDGPGTPRYNLMLSLGGVY